MNKQTPLVQALVGALLVVVLLSAIHIFSGTRPGDPLVYAFIALVMVVGGALTYIRARALKRTESGTQQSRVMLSYPMLALTFLGLVAYGYAFSVLFIQQPGDSLAHGIGFGVGIGAISVVGVYRKNRQLSNSFWKTVAFAVPIGVGAGMMTWALERFV